MNVREQLVKKYPIYESIAMFVGGSLFNVGILFFSTEYVALLCGVGSILFLIGFGKLLGNLK